MRQVPYIAHSEQIELKIPYHLYFTLLHHTLKQRHPVRPTIAAGSRAEALQGVDSAAPAIGSSPCRRESAAG